MFSNFQLGLLFLIPLILGIVIIVIDLLTFDINKPHPGSSYQPSIFRT